MTANKWPKAKTHFEATNREKPLCGILGNGYRRSNHWRRVTCLVCLKKRPKPLPLFDLPGEKWKDIPGLIGRYQASNMGRIKSFVIFNPPRILRNHADPNGYPRVMICINGKPKNRLVHHLVMIAFFGERPIGMDCSHLDGNSANARADNLVWETRLENNRRKQGHNTQPRGEKVALSRLKPNDIPTIRSLHKHGESQYRIASKFGVARSTIQHIVENRTWRHIK